MHHTTIRRLAALLLAMLLLLSTAVAEEPYDLSVTPGLGTDWFNLLLIGTDTRKDEADVGRADTMIICSVNLAEGRVKLTSLARDMWVRYGGSENSGKLNAAHRYGGPQLLMKTINENFGMNLEYYVSLNFYGMIDIVNALGGVTLEISDAEAGQINQRIQQEFADTGTPRAMGGKVTLDGIQALCFTRIRNLDSDFGRTERQRRLLTAMLAQVKDSSVGELLSLVGVCLEHSSTNLGLSDLTGMALSLFGSGLDGFEELSLPSSGNYRNETVDGSSCIMFDAQQVTEELHTFIYAPTAEP